MTRDDYVKYLYATVELPWHKEVTMTDEELENRLIRDLGEERVERIYDSPYASPWDWVCNDVFKYFYQTGWYKLLDSDYLNGQNDAIIMDIMKAHGADWDSMKPVLEFKTAFKFA